MQKNISTFNARLSRINDPRNQSYRDPETGMRIPKRLSKKIIKTQNAIKRDVGIFGILGSVLLGLLCVMAARYVRFQMAEIPDAGTAGQVLMAMDFGLAAVLAFILGAVFRHTTGKHMLGQTLGIVAMLMAGHNLVWMFPAEFAQVYSQAYVEQVRTLTAPQSLYLNGATVVSL